MMTSSPRYTHFKEKGMWEECDRTFEEIKTETPGLLIVLAIVVKCNLANQRIGCVVSCFVTISMNRIAQRIVFPKMIG